MKEIDATAFKMWSKFYVPTWSIFGGPVTIRFKSTLGAGVLLITFIVPSYYLLDHVLLPTSSYTIHSSVETELYKILVTLNTHVKLAFHYDRNFWT